MVLGVDATRAVGRRFGVGMMMEYLLRNWSRQPIPFEKIRVLSPAPIEDLPEDRRLVAEVLPTGTPGLWWQATRLRASARGVDVFFSPYTLPPGFRGRSVVYNFGIYEGSHAIPGWRARGRSRHMARSAHRADLVFANCPTTKADLESFYGVEPSKIRVLPEGRDPRVRPRRPEDDDQIEKVVTELLGSNAPYFIFVGKLSLRRHVPELLKGFAAAFPPGHKARLLLVGPNTTELPVERTVGDAEMADRMRHVPYVDHDVLRLLYRGARAFVTLSEKDGFPTTLLEAMASGCPSLTLKGASLGALEYLDGPRDYAVGGPVLEAADPHPDSLAEAFRRLAEDDELCAELGRRGTRYAVGFPPWDETAAQVMEALAEVAGADRPPGAEQGAAR
jgi:glycosyltransferase involved in cell wall biosynthesis